MKKSLRIFNTTNERWAGLKPTPKQKEFAEKLSETPIVSFFEINREKWQEWKEARNGHAKHFLGSYELIPEIPEQEVNLFWAIPGMAPWVLLGVKGMKPYRSYLIREIKFDGSFTVRVSKYSEHNPRISTSFREVSENVPTFSRIGNVFLNYPFQILVDGVPTATFEGEEPELWLQTLREDVTTSNAKAMEVFQFCGRGDIEHVLSTIVEPEFRKWCGQNGLGFFDDGTDPVDEGPRLEFVSISDMSDEQFNSYMSQFTWDPEEYSLDDLVDEDEEEEEEEEE